MNNITKFISKASVYTVLVLSAFYLYGGVAGLNENGIHWTRFLIIAAYSSLIAAVEILSSKLKIKDIFKTLIQYTVLLLGFVIVFFISSNSEFKPSTLFVAFILFTVTYLAIALASLGIKRLWNKLPDNKAPRSDKPKKKEYSSLFGDK